MRISFGTLVYLALALPLLAAPIANGSEDLSERDDRKAVASAGLPLPTIIVGEDFALEARKAKAATKKVKAPVKAKPVPKPKAKPVAKPKAKPAPKKVAPKPAAKKVAPKPAAKKVSAKPPAKAPAKAAAKPAPKKAPAKVIAKPAAKKAPAKKPTAVAKKPAAKPPAKAPAKAPAKKVTAAKTPVGKPPSKTPVKPAAKPPAKAPAKKVTGAKKPVAKPPAKTPAKPQAKAKPATKPTKSAVKAPAKASASKAVAKPSASAKACPLNAAKKAPSRVKGRAGVNHPSAKGTISLFHATISSSAAALEAQGVLLSKTAASGDFSHRPEVDGGFYMADSLIAAAQFACFEAQQPRTSSVDVLEYTWHGAGQTVHEFGSATADFESFLEYNEGEEDEENTTDPFHKQALEIYKSVMITGPLGGGIFDKDLTKDFLQYAVVNQDAASSKLTLKTRHKNILCKNVPKGAGLTPALYSQTQGGNAGFAAGVAALQDANACT